MLMKNQGAGAGQLFSKGKQLARVGIGGLRSSLARRKPSAGGNVPRFRRYLSDRSDTAEAYLRAASDYVANFQESELPWLYCKPYDRSPGNPAFFTELYQVMNLLKAMNLPFRGRVLEVGSGPGWVTEILVSLGYEVHGLEPSVDMIAIARERVAMAIRHYRLKDPPPYDFFCESLEDCTLPANRYDGIIFQAALHHIIDEDLGMGQCFRLLKPGGILGISEGAWQPGNRQLEAMLDKEMDRFGTLENPFTPEYLDYLLDKHGFVELMRFHGVNGWIPESMGKNSLESMADAPARAFNNVTAIKPGAERPTSRDHKALTRAEIAIKAVNLQSDKSSLVVTVRLKNTGETTWLSRAIGYGWVTVAVRSDPIGGPHFHELSRFNLPGPVDPGAELILDLCLSMPQIASRKSWYIDLVNENLFWFSSRDTKPARLDIPST
jgi:SAM-dependent methyltransferase